jgi:TRAP-type C4-dicarboxylate transport system permease small subunit
MRKTLNLSCGVLAAVALFSVMTLTFFDVGGRKFLSQSIPGSLELTEMLMVMVIFAGLPLVSERGEHVLFDSLDPVWPEWFKNAQKRLVNFLCGLALLGLAWLMWKTGGSFAESGETSALHKIPKYPFIYGMGLLCAVAGAIHLTLAVKPGEEPGEGEGGTL